MHLKLSPRFRSQWASQCWGRWRSWAASLGIPDSVFIRSSDAVERARRKSVAGEFCEGQPHLPEFSCATVALLMLLGKWSSTLRSTSAEHSMAILRSWVLGVLPDVCVWHAVLLAEAPHCWPTEVRDGQDVIEVAVVGGRICLANLLVIRQMRAAVRTASIVCVGIS